MTYSNLASFRPDCWRIGMSEAAKAEREAVDHPAHYGGKDNPYEAIKIIDAIGANFCIGNALKYLIRCDKKGDAVEDLRKAAWYVQHEIERRESSR